MLNAALPRAGMSTRKTRWGFITISCSRERGPSVSIERAGAWEEEVARLMCEDMVWSMSITPLRVSTMVVSGTGMLRRRLSPESPCSDCRSSRAASLRRIPFNCSSI